MRAVTVGADRQFDALAVAGIDDFNIAAVKIGADVQTHGVSLYAQVPGCGNYFTGILTGFSVVDRSLVIS
ncbi:putative uncharacterized protein [Pseudomonas sp. StFLB209]|nr:putative uncharacterized protein [Pseudomonas sp. StFLB209]